MCAVHVFELILLKHSTAWHVLTMAWTTGTCSDCPPAADVPDGTSFRQTLDWNNMVGVMTLRPGAKLRLINLHLENFATGRSVYTYSSSTPFLSVGVGVGVFPTINLAPNTTVSANNRQMQSRVRMLDHHSIDHNPPRRSI